MNKSVFEYLDYRRFLIAHLGSVNSRSGLRSRLAKGLGCHPSYLSQVLKGKTNLSPEQAERACEHLGLTAEELQYFMLLVSKARAGTSSLQMFYENQIREIKKQKGEIKRNLPKAKSISESIRSRYYSSWQYGAIHAITSIPGCQTKEQIANRLGLSLSAVSRILSFLVSAGLVEEQGGKYKTGAVLIHLEKDSTEIQKHHLNWRIQAMTSIEKGEALSELHYSAAMSLSREDAQLVQQILVQTIKSIAERSAESKEEALFSLTVDWFDLFVRGG